ncbi:flagellar basal body P-ring formation protein FlgA [Legionella israelensis]|uniref:flagellar basal body P-ring formation chaperone FlgA n=1 Tax=Legionella israelensis TaxID=454 RepID=UPI00117FCEEF|nr:flagellar basal body P-ring formation chaperone FlgA [Legionella israelensis]QDP73469.1 flagellar basal body P-ring formation protein FlgA [Legionella israelensis]
MIKGNAKRLSIAVLLSISPLALTQSFTNFQSFKHHIHDFVMQQTPHRGDEDLHVDILQLNEKMPLPSCPNDIQFSLSSQGISSNSNVVTLECHSSQPWRLFVPIQIQIFTNVLAAAHMVKPGEIITKEDVKIIKKDKTTLYDGYFSDTDEITGYIASSLIPADGVFAKKNLKKIPLIQKKQNIKLILKHGTLEISMRGVAQENGFLNDQIKIINPSSQKTVTAKVVSNATAEIIY